MVLYLLRYIKTTKRINPFSPNAPLIEKLGSWFLLPKCVKKYIWKCQTFYTLFYCDILTPLVRDGLFNVNFTKIVELKFI